MGAAGAIGAAAREAALMTTDGVIVIVIWWVVGLTVFLAGYVLWQER